ncbi:MAG: hypothetical protein RBG13Loki_1319 [Promethearchaeota archaeon CR_4]|nr:MAG: hypothetical protein RBG13Loki_1319 [Candidatus Lokiarchaeota archaeon CR_4]
MRWAIVRSSYFFLRRVISALTVFSRSRTALTASSILLSPLMRSYCVLSSFCSSLRRLILSSYMVIACVSEEVCALRSDNFSSTFERDASAVTILSSCFRWASCSLAIFCLNPSISPLIPLISFWEAAIASSILSASPFNFLSSLFWSILSFSSLVTCFSSRPFSVLREEIFLSLVLICLVSPVFSFVTSLTLSSRSLAPTPQSSISFVAALIFPSISFRSRLAFDTKSSKLSPSLSWGCNPSNLVLR